MNKFLMVLVTLMVSMFSINALAYDPPAAPPNGGYVVDQSGKLSTTQIQQLNRKIDAISKSTKNEFGVLLLPNMGGDNIEDVASSTYKKWGVGKRGLDNGCLIVVAIKERKSRIETGKGVEGEVTDLQASDILKTNLNPHLRTGDFYGGFDDTLNHLGALMESRHNQKADPAPVASTPVTQPAANSGNTTPAARRGCDVSGVGTSNSSGGTWLVILLLGVGGTVAVLMARAAKRRRDREDTERLAAAKRRKEKEDQIRLLQARLTKERAARLAKATPAVAVPVMPSRSTIAPPPMVHAHAAPHPITRGGEVVESVVPTRPEPRPAKASHAATYDVAALAAGAAAVAAAEREHEATLRRERAEREDAERRSREEADRQSSSSSYSSYSSSDSSSSSYSTPDYGSSSGSDSGGGFGGGDSGGGGSSSDW